MQYIFPFLCLILLALPLEGQQKREPFGLKTVTPQFTTSAWSQFLGIGLNYMLNPTQDIRGDTFYETNQWFTTGKGNPFTGMDKLEPSQQHIIHVSYGSLTIKSEPLEKRSRPLIKSNDKLHITYDLTLPINPLNGLVYLSLTANAPLPSIKAGEMLRIGLWIRGEIESAQQEDLTVSGALATFGGDIFTEQVMRLMLSYRPPEMRYLPPTYRIVTESSELQIGPQRVPEVVEQLRTLRRAHAADTPRGIASKNGFFVNSRWVYITSRPFTVTDWDLQTGIISFEVLIQLPYSDSLKDEGAVWDNVKGYIDFSGFDWWVEAS